MLELGFQEDDPGTFTIAPPSARPQSSGTSGEGRFVAGTVLGDRYRVLGLVGSGGMGEVYRATDLKLNQPVALKFLPESTARDRALLERFHGEVRMARQVSHLNVCRVYDIGEVDGAAYISMEYVDGEDLSSLLRRIGRLPGDKAIEIARKLCAGVAAAHAKGVLHRDLKPSNVMIDGRGEVLIMDFGLAAIADQVEGPEVRNGTPAYMAPEQLAGREVSERSDIYALGLVLYEIFTGQKAFTSADRRVTPNAASAAKEIDPVIERAIARCLDPDPSKRPQSALALARMLPGGDPMAEALAAGDTPSPEMVAASEDTGALSVRLAVVSMALVVVGLTASLLLTAKSSVLRLTPFPNSYEVLAQKARDIAARLGYTDPPADHFYKFTYDTDYQKWAGKNLKPDQYRAQVSQGQPPLIFFAYRQSPQYLWPRAPGGALFQAEDDPPETISGMVGMRLDPEGRLIQFRAVPPQLDSGNSPARKMDWSKLLEAAGLDPSRWTPTESHEVPLVAFDERAAWTGAYAHAPYMPMRIEAAAWQGRPVFFEVFGPWRRPVRMQPREQSTAVERLVPVAGISLLTLLLVSALWLAWRNFRLGRGDTRGSLRLAAAALICYALGSFVQLHHVPLLLEFGNIVSAITAGMLGAALVSVLYMALEPYLRRRLPQSLISWTRLLAGDVRDPLVAGHLLAGTALGACVGALGRMADWLEWQRSAVLAPSAFMITTLDGAGLVRGLLSSPFSVTAIAMGVFFLLLIFRLILRKTWLAAAAFVLLGALFAAATSAAPVEAALVSAGFYTLILWVMIRFGVLPCALMLLVAAETVNWPLTSDFSAWYADKGLIVVAVMLALAMWSFRNALGGRKVLQDDLL
ncbi:MAG TPA: serine/threonine-protein kinase [Bryobacteraceae bacterium]|nr:serine/threonine-protein kinase [Bryobacteraceae bacterium]